MFVTQLSMRFFSFEDFFSGIVLTYLHYFKNSVVAKLNKGFNFQKLEKWNNYWSILLNLVTWICTAASTNSDKIPIENYAHIKPASI